MRSLCVAVLGIVVAGCAGTTRFEPDRLTAPRDRITDQAVAADMAVLGQWDARLAALRRPTLDIDQVRYGDAQQWLAAARQAYTDNDRSGDAQVALDKAIAVISALELDRHYRRSHFADSTPRADSADRDLGRAEVALQLAEWHDDVVAVCHGIWYADLADRLLRESTVLARVSLPVDTAPDVGARAISADAGIHLAPAVVLAALPDASEVTMVAHAVHFAVNVTKVSEASRPELDRLVALLQKYPTVLVELDGRADARGSAAHNLVLSRERARAVRAYLMAGAIDSSRVLVAYRGPASVSVGASLENYARDRAVLIRLVGIDGRPIGLETQERDLQVEQAHALRAAPVVKMKKKVPAPPTKSKQPASNQPVRPSVSNQPARPNPSNH